MAKQEVHIRDRSLNNFFFLLLPLCARKCRSCQISWVIYTKTKPNRLIKRFPRNSTDGCVCVSVQWRSSYSILDSWKGRYHLCCWGVYSHAVLYQIQFVDRPHTRKRNSRFWQRDRKTVYHSCSLGRVSVTSCFCMFTTNKACCNLYNFLSVVIIATNENTHPLTLFPLLHVTFLFGGLEWSVCKEAQGSGYVV